jgi:hypothetical protein
MLLALQVITLYGWALDRHALLVLGSAWTVVFAVLEGAGWYRNVQRHGEREVARTLSQVMQWFAYRDKGGSFWATLTGWDALVTGVCVQAGAMVGYMAGQSVHPYLGWWVGAVVVAWNYGHWHNRRKHG